MKQATKIKEIETAIVENKEMAVSKNRKDSDVVMSMEEYRRKIQKKEIIEKLKKSEKEIQNGEGIDSDTAFKELRLKYGY